MIFASNSFGFRGPYIRSFTWKHLQPDLAKIQCALVQVVDGGLDQLDRSWKLPNRSFPYSCTNEEGIIMVKIISLNYLKSGFEVATAFGYSATFAALAMKLSGGCLHSIDSYIEETMNDFKYLPTQIRIAINETKAKIKNGIFPDGLAKAQFAAETLGLDPIIRFHVGITPDDVAFLLKNQKVDYVLIDGGHYDNQPSLDFH